MIPSETRYETHNGELPAIIEAFKTWRHYLEGYKYEILVLIDHNNLRQFTDTKSLSFRQVWWAQKLSQYHFQINYHQEKANRAADVLSRFSQRNQAEKDKLQIENTRILHKLQSSLTNASLSSLSTSVELSPLHQVLICGTHVLPQLRQFWDTFQAKLANENFYKASIGGMRLRLSELQESDPEAQKLKSKEQLPDNWEDIDGVLYHQGLSFVPEAIQTEIISRYHDDLLVGYFSINKTKDLVSRKYYWPSLQRNIEAYVKGCSVCLSSKAVRHKSYSDL